ncbi:hypothetical protein ACVS9S_004285 [Cronobacter dublinensis]|uniref:hypothetical protein n=1 Tax=Cronobacter turicensis TaxID=413502 RepID=UPI0013758C77|nr:hypothetical protein [Cronobacter turicensis]NCH24787.1 hypothetical protein [Cronobacter turicensis]
MSAKDKFFEKYEESKRQNSEEFEKFGTASVQCKNHIHSLLKEITGWVNYVTKDVTCIENTTKVTLPPYSDRTTEMEALEIETRYKRLSIVPKAAPGNATQVMAVAYLNEDKKSEDLGDVIFEFHLQNNQWVIADLSTPPNILPLNEDNFFTAIMPLA